MKILFHYPPTIPFISSKTLKAFLKAFPTKMKSTKCPVKEKKMRQKKWKKKGGERAKLLSLLTTQKICNILLSAHARTSQANILHLDQKAAKCMTCKWLYGKF